ncbi:head GIN domain-containing protein [Roseateles amylovorans]|uniref:DUF2807 domain-containing protein n=1 Tax=Roseateles amylovorans TaxID=2978473 RepID=A0ABY6B404_9BURK|nr:head GIN domain-containing protein [Roseateles amylovorans]UXH78981.1 DUF2807 domain-containing protein [Roseateles amylovorans]
MNNIRRFLAASLISVAAVGSAHAWSWSFGGSQRIEGGGDVTTESRDVGAFDAVGLSGSFKVVVRQGTTDKVEIKADRNLLPYLETKVSEGSKGRTLEINSKRGFQLSASTTPVIFLEMRQLRGLSIAGSGEISVEPMKTAGPVDASIAGSGDIRINGLDAERVGLRVSGSGDIVASGKANSLSVSVAGSGDVRARGLVVDEAKVSIAGSGDVSVQAAKRLNVSIAGSGDVGYMGNPEISMSNAGSGRVRKLKD